MTEQELIQMRDLAEVGKTQFKERVIDKYEIGCEIVAFSNSHGGRIVIGINDKSGVINALSYRELQETTNLLTNIASENVIPNVLIDVDNVPTSGGAIVVVTIPEGKNKPYHDNKGIIWVKNGADKRKVFDNSELAEMMSLEDAVKNADYISMHLPFTPETDKMVNKELIGKMTHHPVIINTGRGKCVNETDVAEALRSGAISWYCTDVYSSEPPAEDNPLLGCENVTFTPHVGANTNENLLRIGEEVLETIGSLVKEGRL